MLTQQYLEEHANNVKSGKGKDKNDYEAFGREIAELLMRTAAQDNSLKTSSTVEEVNFTATVKITQMKSLLCVRGEVCTPLGCVSAHVGAS